MSSPHVASGAASLDPRASEASSEPASSSVVSDLVENDEACTLIRSKNQHKRSGSNVNNPPHLFAENTLILKHKRRYCKIEGCNSIVKSQGLCQRHGAKPKTCKVEGCTKQAQGNFDKMCKAHFKAMKRVTTPIPKVENKDVPPPAQGFSVYDSILPDSLNFVTDEHNNDTRKLPLIVHLKDGFDTLKPPAWHRNEERRARGMFPIDNPAAQLEGWERELVWMEILVLTGVPGASFRHLARAWGRDKGFHMVLAQFICERQGDVERKKRHGEKKGDVKKKRRKVASPKKATPNSNAKAEVDSSNGSGTYNSNEDVGADVWDPSLYGDVDTNEALAAEIFDFTEKEFERVVSKYKQGTDDSVSTTSGRNISMSSTTTDIVAQAAMTALLGEQQQQQQPMHHRSNSMHSTASNSNHEDIMPTPVHVEVTAGGDSTNPINQPPTIPSNATMAPGYPNQVAPQQQQQQQQQQIPELMSPPPQQQQQQQQQQQVFQQVTQVPAPPPPPPMQIPAHAYPPQQQQHIPGQAAPHQIIQQQQQQQHQLSAFSMHQAPIAQAPPPQQGASQPVAQQMQTPMQQVQAHAQPYSQQQQPYAVPAGQLQQPLAPISVPAPATQFSHSQPPMIQQQHSQPQQGQHEQQYQVNLPSYPQHNPPAPQHHEDVSYERKLLNSYEATANPPLQQSHSIAQRPLVPIAAPHPHEQQAQQQQHQHQLPLQYAETNRVPGPSPVELAPTQSHTQHQAPFPPDQQQQQQMHTQIETHPPGTASALPQVSGQQIAHASYPPQHHAQQPEQLTNHPAIQRTEAQDPLDVHHEMNAAREDQT